MEEEEKKFEDFVLQKKEGVGVAEDNGRSPEIAQDAHTSSHYSRKGSKKSKKSGSKKSKKSHSSSDSDDDGECPDPDSSVLPCADPLLPYVCDKYNTELGNFKECFDMCRDSFCCIHDSRSRTVAPSCSQTADNCRMYSPCYILWWKLSATVGPATYFYVSQADDFFPKFDDYASTFDDEFINELLGYHFDDDTVNQTKFLDENEW